MTRFWQCSTSPDTHVWLEHPGDPFRCRYVVERAGVILHTQVAEPTPEELGKVGTTRRDMFVCGSCRHAYPLNMQAGYTRRGLPWCTQCKLRLDRTEAAV